MTEPQLRFPKLSRIRKEVKFYKHQVDGINRLLNMQSFLLADDMGLGKSLQALTVAAVDFERGVADKMLVVCLNSIKYNWLEEIERHTTFTAMVLDGTPRKRDKKLQEFIDGGYEVLITNYEMVVKHLGDLNKLDFDIVIFDEAHAIKNKDRHRTRASFGLIAQRYFLLTGSPLLNRVNELWTLLHRIDPAQFPSYWRFANRYVIFGGFEGREVVGTKNAGELREKLGALMLRRKKEDVLDLPWFKNQEWLKLTDEQRKMYKTAQEDLRVEHPTTDMTIMEINATISRYGRLSQIASTTKNLVVDLDKSSKLNRMEDLVRALVSDGESVVVFVRYRGTIEAAEERLRSMKINSKRIPIYVLHGDVKPEERQKRIQKWTNDTANGKPGVLLAMLQVGGVGLNFTAASTVIFVDRWEVPKLNQQAIDRLNRIGQTKPVQVVELLAQGTIDRRVEKLIQRKDVTFEDVVEGASYDNSWKKKLIEAMQEEEDEE